jgi:hypothetical protein
MAEERTVLDVTASGWQADLALRVGGMSDNDLIALYLLGDELPGEGWGLVLEELKKRGQVA